LRESPFSLSLNEMTSVRIREFQKYDYKDPRDWLVAMKEIESIVIKSNLSYPARSLRTNKLREWNDRRIAALFAFGMSQRMPGFWLDFAGVARSDYDAVVRHHNDEECIFTPIQIKEFVSEQLNKDTTVEELLDSLTKYSNSPDLVVVFFLNRRMKIRLHPISSDQVRLGGLYFLGAASPDGMRWNLMGDLLHSAEISQFTYPTHSLREVISNISGPVFPAP
jgi:hypothetical protein